MPRQPEHQAGGGEKERETVSPFRPAGQPDDARYAEDGCDGAFQEGLGAKETEYAEYGVGSQEPGGDHTCQGMTGQGLRS